MSVSVVIPAYNAADCIERAIHYFHAISDYLKERKNPYHAIVAFSGEHEYGGQKVTETSLNGFPSNLIPERFRDAIDVRRFGVGERVVPLPYTPEMFEKTQAWMHTRNLFDATSAVNA